MANEKVLNTRIQLKYDSYENWIAAAKQFKLRPGEVAVVNINGANGGNLNNGTPNTVTQPTILFKVGIGNPADEATWKTFNELPWASALAADVYAWAKQSENDFVKNFLTLKTTDEKGTPTTMQAALDGVFATDAELAAAIGDIQNALKDYYSKQAIDEFLGEIENSMPVITEGTGISVTPGGEGSEHVYTVSLDADEAKTELGLGDAAYTTIASLNAIASGYVDALKQDMDNGNFVPSEANQVTNALTITVGGADVEFNGSAPQTADVDAAIAAAEQRAKDYADAKPHVDTKTTVTSDDDYIVVNAPTSFVEGGTNNYSVKVNEAALKTLIGQQTTAAMEFKGATNTLPTDPAKGDMYKVAGENINIKIEGVDAKLGDSIVYDGTNWYLIPSGDDIEDTWRPVKVGDNTLETSETLEFVNGTNVSIAENSGKVTFNAVDTTYSFAKKAGTDLTFTVTPSEGDAYDVTVEANGKADKVSGATEGNFAALDENGNLTDSGKKAADFLGNDGSNAANDFAITAETIKFTTTDNTPLEVSATEILLNDKPVVVANTDEVYIFNCGTATT